MKPILFILRPKDLGNVQEVYIIFCLLLAALPYLAQSFRVPYLGRH